MKNAFGWLMVIVFALSAGVAYADQPTSTNGATSAATPVSKVKKAKAAKKKAVKDVYVCPMCHITSDKPGKCPQCGMEMVKEKKAEEKPKSPAKKSKDMSQAKPKGLDVAKYGRGKDAKICPVSGEKIKAGHGAELALSNGKKIMVCCDDCQKDIEKDLAQYASLMY